MAMTLFEALEVLAAHRGDRIVVTAMSSVELWPQISDTPMDFNYLPSTMGQAPAFGLGLALSRPERGVIVVNGDGCLLMNLGCLVTIASHPAHLYLIIVDNGHYEVTGGQPTAGSGQIDFPGLARAAGISRVYAFEEQQSWRRGAEEALRGDGPVFICLKVEPVFGRKTPKPPRPMAEQIDRLKQTLAVSRDSDL
jgi:thiamine pyrophosphate-dependent acetolactate synthase large subunit-like protein